MKRFRGTRLFVIAMLCLLPLSVLRADDCNGSYYDPNYQGCCSGQVYDLGTQECCNGTMVVSLGSCSTMMTCNGELYDPGSQECCGNLIVPIGQCCSGMPLDPSLQVCCTDGHIADIGQCDPPPLCNNVPFDPVTQECCGSLIVPLGTCCNGSQYDSSTQRCCGGVVVNPNQCCNDQVYDPSAQDCCGDGTLASPGQCGWSSCNGTAYDPASQMCCGGALYDASFQCCNGLPYDPGTQECCGSGLIAPLGQCAWLDCGGTAYNPDTHGCCSLQQVYELATQECCGATVVTLGNCCNGTPIEPLLQGCCDNQPYDLMTEECCGGVVVLKEYCCNGTLIIPGEQGCCQGQIPYTLAGYTCCADARVVPSGQCDWLDCNGTLYDSATHDCCNNGQVYERATQTCCWDGSTVMNGEPCPPPPELCNGLPYDTATLGCCNNDTYSLSSYCCLNNAIVSVTSTGECPTACGAGYYDPVTHDCCNGQIYERATQECCGGTPVTQGQCCNGVPLNAGEECCADNTIATAGQCGWPICGGGRYDPTSGLECCNGQTYSPATQICCDNTTVVDIGQCHPSFCDNVPFNPGESECCNGEIVPLGNCCANQIINPATQGCGGGHVIYDLATQEYNPYIDAAVPIGQGSWPGCGGVAYDNMTYVCCSDNTLALIGQCPQSPELCGSTPYDPGTQGCCNIIIARFTPWAARSVAATASFFQRANATGQGAMANPTTSKSRNVAPARSSRPSATAHSAAPPFTIPATRAAARISGHTTRRPSRVAGMAPLCRKANARSRADREPTTLSLRYAAVVTLMTMPRVLFVARTARSFSMASPAPCIAMARNTTRRSMDAATISATSWQVDNSVAAIRSMIRL